MKMLVQRVAGDALPFNIEDLKDHLRLLGEDDFDGEVFKAGKAAAEEIEHFAQVALLTQTIKVTIFNAPCDLGLSLPIGPVSDSDMPVVTIDGAAFTAFDFVGGVRPYIRWQADYFSLARETVTIVYQAGFGADAGAVPPDLAQALMDQAALLFDGRSPMDAKALTTSPHMARIGARYRGVQV
ncbi:head-tail connector protein [Primorskyibacter sp. 2E107]|uniref:head-tail connector protein n=1 Tax=Primorskyibacter sp. 2E107 TaxID=3403458 RepID=UPI003AF872B6